MTAVSLFSRPGVLPAPCCLVQSSLPRLSLSVSLPGTGRAIAAGSRAGGTRPPRGLPSSTVRPSATFRARAGNSGGSGRRGLLSSSHFCRLGWGLPCYPRWQVRCIGRGRVRCLPGGLLAHFPCPCCSLAPSSLPTPRPHGHPGLPASLALHPQRDSSSPGVPRGSCIPQQSGAGAGRGVKCSKACEPGGVAAN